MIKKFDIVKVSDILKGVDCGRHWIALLITQEEIDNDKDCLIDEPGLYLFGGMWYGNDVTNRMSFGKYIMLPNKEEKYTIVGSKDDYKISQLKRMFN
jgi:hypothetical protein